MTEVRGMDYFYVYITCLPKDCLIGYSYFRILRMMKSPSQAFHALLVPRSMHHLQLLQL